MIKLLSNWESSGKSLLAYSKIVDVSYYKLKYWYYKLNKEKNKEAVAFAREEVQTGFIPIEVPKPQIDLGGIELTYPNQVKVTIPRDTNIETLKILIKLY